MACTFPEQSRILADRVLSMQGFAYGLLDVLNVSSFSSRERVQNLQLTLRSSAVSPMQKHFQCVVGAVELPRHIRWT